jgi:penicillin-binding protein 2
MEKKETDKKKKKFTRYTAMVIMCIIMIAMIAIRLAAIQIVHGEEYRVQAMDKSIRTVEDSALRGKIKDRNGIDLASNDQVYSVFMMQPQEEFDDLTLMKVIERLIDVLDKNNEKIKEDFPIAVKCGADGVYEYAFEFQNNYTDEAEIQEYNEKAAARWKKDNNIPESLDAMQTFEYLKSKDGKYKYEIKPEQEAHNNPVFIRKMMAVRQKIEDMGYKLYKPVEIACVSKKTAIDMMEMGLYLPGVDYSVRSVRKYPFGELAANIIGSLRKIPGDRVSEYKDKHYDVNTDLVGRDGIELYAEDDLRGEKGGRTVRVDKLGRIVEELGKSDPVPGNNVVLTIDKNLQQAAENILDNVISKLTRGELKTKQGETCTEATRGAAVVIDVKTGEILAMASRPGGYDPNLMAATGGISN